MENFMETQEKSGFLKINLRDIIRGLMVAGLFGALQIATSVDNVLDFAKPELWLDVANGTWKAVSAYLILNILSKKS